MCNLEPLTQECQELPPIQFTDFYFVGKGLGYDCTTEEYKVVVIDSLSHLGFHVFGTFVYGLKSGGWRMVKNCPHQLTGSTEGVFLNGKLHWLSQDSIIAFNIGLEDYYQLALPEVLYGYREVYFNALGGHLFLSYYYHDELYDVWIMNHYGVKKSWVKLFSLNKLDIIGGMTTLRPVAYLKTKGQVLMQLGYWGLYVVNVEDNSVRKVSIHGHPCLSSAQVCAGSLFRLGARGDSTPTSARKRMKRDTGTRLTFCVEDVDCGFSSYSSDEDYFYDDVLFVEGSDE